MVRDPGKPMKALGTCQTFNSWPGSENIVQGWDLPKGFVVGLVRWAPGPSSCSMRYSASRKCVV